MTEPYPAKKRGLKRWLIIAMALAMIVLAAFWFGGSPNLPTGPIRYVRDAAGRLVPADENARQSDGPLELHAAKIEARNNFSSSCASSRSNRARFACRRLAIFNLSDHPLLQRAGAELASRLKQLDYLEQLEYHPNGLVPDEGRLAPEIVITLDFDKLEDSVTLLSRELDATILVTAGSSLAKGRSGYIDNLTPPVLRFGWQGSLHHRSTTTGLVSGAAKYKLAAENIAKQIADTLSKQFDDWHKKDGPLPKLPEAFYPPYRKPKKLPFLDDYQVQRVVANHGLTNHNETFWRLTSGRDPDEVLSDIQQQMEAAGWKTSSISTQQDRLPHLRMFHGATVLYVFPVERPGHELTIDAATDNQSQATLLYVHYLDRMTKTELKEAVELTFAEDVPIDVLILFEHQWNKDQSQRALEILKSRGPKTPDAWLTLAKLHQRLGQKAESRDALLRAHLLLRTVGDQGDLSNRIRSLAKKLGDEKLTDKTIDPEMMRQLGFIELKPGVKIPDVELALDEPAHFFAYSAEGELKTISLRVVSSVSEQAETTYQIAHVESFNNGRSWGSGGTLSEKSPAHHHAAVDGTCQAEFSVVKLAEQPRFRVSVEVRPSIGKR